MKSESIQAVVQGWDTVRFELLKTRISDLRLKIEGSPVEPFIDRLYRELELKGLKLKPKVYLTDEWGCPDRTPVIGIPFYLADDRLGRIEEEQNGEVEDPRNIMMLLRHEAGHALNYGYRLWTRPSWVEIFGSFTKPYHDIFRPQKLSRNYVKHIEAYPYGRTYAQKHPDEDFAETFAVWLTPRSNWKAHYKNWPAIRKLKLVDRLMRTVCRQAPVRLRRRLLMPVETMDILLADYYGQKAARLREEAQGYVDDKLREIFPAVRAGDLASAAELFRAHRAEILARIERWAGLDTEEAEELVAKLESRADALELAYRSRDDYARLLDAMAVAISLAMDYTYVGRFAT